MATMTINTTATKAHASSALKNAIIDDEPEQDLKVTFMPPLYQQRRIWILNFLRKEGVTRVLDVGCGEGELLAVLCRPAPWLSPPSNEFMTAWLNGGPTSPSTLNDSSSLPKPQRQRAPSPTPAFIEGEIPNLHVTEVHGLDIHRPDLEFAVQAITPPQHIPEVTQPSLIEGDPPSGDLSNSFTMVNSPVVRSFGAQVERWEGMDASVWLGGLEVPNAKFVDMECIVAMEVIEHLTPATFPKFAPTLLGLYHPTYFLVTTPSYTYNARFSVPSADTTRATGFPDPTGRTERVFRHADHKFEWTREEFTTWCRETAAEWGYEVNETTIGRALEIDPFGRDDELQGASQVAAFWRRDPAVGHVLGQEGMSNEAREEKAKTILEKISATQQAEGIVQEEKPHELLANFTHAPHASSRRPAPLSEIAAAVTASMEEWRVSFMRMEELWFEPHIPALCGGYIELLVRAVEDSPLLNLKRDVDGVKKGQDMWNVELLSLDGNPRTSADLWPGETSGDYIPEGWTPIEGPYEIAEEMEYSDADDSTTGGEEGDVSCNTASEDDGGLGDDESDGEMWGKGKAAVGSWGNMSVDVSDQDGWGEGGWGVDVPQTAHSAMSSTAGWDGDEDESDDTTS